MDLHEEHSCHWPSCEAAFVDASELKLHLKNHSEHCPHGCDWPGCGYRAKSVDVLNRHKRTVHSTLKPYSCDWTECEAKSTN